MGKYNLLKYKYIKKIKSFFIKTLISFSKRTWEMSDATKILIQTNNFFTKENWLKSFAGIDLINAEIQFTNNKFDFIKLAGEANIIFTYGMNSNINWKRKDLQLIYFGINGIEFFDKETILPGTTIAYPKGIASQAIAEYVLMSALILNRKIQYAFNHKGKRKWNQRDILSQKYTPLSKKSIGLLGVGNVGKIIAEILKSHNCTIYAFDKIIDSTNNNIDKWYTNDNIDDFFKSIDILVIALPLNHKTVNFVNKSRLELLKQGSLIINISRGKLIDENTLIKLLKNKAIAGAALDVFIEEPLPSNSELWRIPNAIITPHIAGNINLFVEEIQKDFINKLIKNKNYFV